jgi:alpha-amylase/alpha-mannosidase (GH57 family)
VANDGRTWKAEKLVTDTSHRFLCIYGHFYQPPREDPFTGHIPREPGSAPFENFNEKITDECYRPNAEAGNLALISFDLGPTLAAWLEQRHPDVYQAFLAADRAHRARYGVGNALAQAYNHAILPLATSRDKRTQIRWGLDDFAHRFGHRADGMWLAETAVDQETLSILAEEGVRYTVLAPWQAAEPATPGEPYLVSLPGGRSITVFFYHGALSAAVSFEDQATSNADVFAATRLRQQVNEAKAERGEDQLVLVATDGELYGHHKPLRQYFLQHLLRRSAPAQGFEVTTLARYLEAHPPQRTITLRLPSAWSCAHGVARWDGGCDCTEGDSSWKHALRTALNHLAVRLDTVYADATAATLRDPWAARDEWLAVRSGWMSGRAFWTRYGIHGRRPLRRTRAEASKQLLEAQYYAQAMFTSCGFFFEDLDRIEPRNDIALARRAISLVWQATHIDLQAAFLADLAQARSGRTGRTGADLYRDLPPASEGALPPLGAPAPVSETAA